MNMFLMIDLSNKKVVIVGGGKVVICCVKILLVYIKYIYVVSLIIIDIL